MPLVVIQDYTGSSPVGYPAEDFADIAELV